MPNDMPPLADAAARVKALRERLDEIGKALEALQTERTSVTRELAAMWVNDDPGDVPAAASGNNGAAPAKAAPKKAKTSTRSPKNKRKS